MFDKKRVMGIEPEGRVKPGRRRPDVPTPRIIKPIVDKAYLLNPAIRPALAIRPKINKLSKR